NRSSQSSQVGNYFPHLTPSLSSFLFSSNSSVSHIYFPHSSSENSLHFFIVSGGCITIEAPSPLLVSPFSEVAVPAFGFSFSTSFYSPIMDLGSRSSSQCATCHLVASLATSPSSFSKWFLSRESNLGHNFSKSQP
ncbi:hypothetical protein V2J09_004052, partial [Rumex salicifolius]